jgi:hypothetical protein
MSALIVTLGANITALRQAMVGATQLVADSAKKMANLSGVGLKVGLGAALAGGASALAGGIKAVTSAANFEQTQVACGCRSHADCVREGASRSSPSPPKPAGPRTGSSTCRWPASPSINTACCGGTACGPTGAAPVRADARSTSNWRPSGAGGSTKASIAPTLALPDRAGSVSRDQTRMKKAVD